MKVRSFSRAIVLQYISQTKVKKKPETTLLKSKMSTSASAAPSIPPTSTPDSKILSDLATVIEKINLCTSMLYPLTSTYQIDQDESLLTIIGFLEACCPRVRELIEAGMTGALQEDTVVKCLTVNDLLLQVLEFVEHPETCNPKEEEEVKEEDQKVEAVVDNFDAFGIMDEDDLLDDFDSKPAATSSSTVEETAKEKTNHLDDLLLAPVPEPVSNATTTSTTAETTTPKEDTTTDDFDDFFNSRVSSQQS